MQARKDVKVELEPRSLAIAGLQLPPQVKSAEVPVCKKPKTPTDLLRSKGTA